MPSSSSSSSQPNVSQHLKKFYNLLRDGGLIGLPPYEKVQFNRVIIKTNNTSSCNSYSKKNRSGSSSSSSTMNLSSPFESIKALRVKDAMELRRHIEKEVARTSKREIENFCFALESMIADEYFFSLCLIPFESGEGNVSFSSNESFFKMLLNISTIQSSIFDVLFKELMSRCPNYEEDSFEQWDRNLPKLILSQMRWLDMISDSKSLTEHIGTILEVASTDFAKEMITAIPEIIDDSEHDHIVDKLDQVMQDKTEMTSCVIDALSNLNLQKEVMDKTTERVLGNLNSASTDDLPVIIKFLLQSANEENISNVVDGIRKDLDVSSFTMQDDTQDNDENHDHSSRKNKGKGSSESRCESLIISAMATGIRHRKIIEKSFIQAISACEEEHTIVDLWILFSIYSMPNYRKDAEQVLKKKIKTKRITYELLKSSIENHGEALEQYFSSLNDLASSLLRNTTDTSISQFAMEMYFCMFCSFKADYNKQKVIQSLITHVGSSSKNEKDLALDVLLMIANSKLSLLRNYSSFFQVLLDSLTNLTDGQVRKVYTLFSMLAYTKTLKNSTQSGVTKSTKDELMIIIRKQLSNTNTVYKKMGIIGACSVLSMLGSRSSEFQALSQVSDQQDLSDEEFEEAKDLWEFALKCCFRTPIFKTILYDEMTFVILDSLDPKLTAEIKNRLLHDFYQRCTIEKPDLKKQKSQTRNLEYRAQFIVQGKNKEDPTHLINILPLLDNKRDDTHESVWNLFSQFRLMRVLMNKLGEELSDDLVSSGVVLFDHEDMITNFRDYTKNEKDLHPTFHLPHFNLLTQQEVPESVTSKKTSSKSKKKQPSAVPEDEEDKEEDAMEDDEEMTSKSSSTKNTEYSSTPTKRKHLSPLKPHYRELDLKVIHIIPKNENCEKKIEPVHLFYILDDLHQKLKSVIARNKVSFFTSKEKENMYNLSRISTKEFFSEIFELLPQLYKQIRAISDKSASNDSSSQAVDEDEESTKNGDFIVPSFQLLVDIITKTLEYFSSDKLEFCKIIDIMFSVDFPDEDHSMEDEDKCTKLFESIRKILDSLKSFESCYKLYELLKSIALVSNIKSLLKALQGVAEQILQTPFSQVKSDALGNLIEGYITLPGGLTPLVEALSKKAK
ncbi:hypothetical protein FDP41_005019 [Naegleria fowleri]|uniref:Uncharacterized protein n=1 Tax=Naegleria fowleri TaxID=5763 RepID=A0A6A5BLG7_NAEFO|nr:uncharacterized protein FDP41_005019 [Naegleria fowleri]KAF0975692.1 hypothetical protein FDP41_005019 [Naegleria fowleri]